MKPLKLRLCPFVLSADDFSNDAKKKDGASSACIYIYIYIYLLLFFFFCSKIKFDNWMFYWAQGVFAWVENPKLYPII